MKNKYNLSWRGMLTVENVQQVADLLHKLLDGKCYTFITANEFFQFKPEVQTKQHFLSNEGAVGVYYDEENTPPKYAGFNVNDTRGVWSCSTNSTDIRKDPEFKNPYLFFENDRVTITHRAPAGNLLYWVIVAEQYLE